MKWQLNVSNNAIVVDLPDQLGDDRYFMAKVNGKAVRCRWHRISKTLEIETANGPLHISPRTFAKERFAGDAETRLHLEYWDAKALTACVFDATAQLFAPGQDPRARSAKAGKNVVRAPMTGKVLSVAVEAGQKVEPGQIICVIEAMKMENKVFATTAGIIEKLNVAQGGSVTVGQELIKLTAAPAN